MSGNQQALGVAADAAALPPSGLSRSASQAKPAAANAIPTPGPWAATPMVGGCDNAFYISGNLAANNGEVDICNVGPSLNPSTGANARLIAAAPDLLAGAQYALEVLAPQKDDDFVWSAMSQLMNAIAKAKGEDS